MGGLYTEAIHMYNTVISLLQSCKSFCYSVVSMMLITLLSDICNFPSYLQVLSIQSELFSLQKRIGDAETQLVQLLETKKVAAAGSNQQLHIIIQMQSYIVVSEEICPYVKQFVQFLSTQP